MTRQPLSSSSLVSAGHEGNVLELEFRNGGVYRYEGVTSEQFAALVSADSPGRYFQQHLRNIAGTRVGAKAS